MPQQSCSLLAVYHPLGLHETDPEYISSTKTHETQHEDYQVAVARKSDRPLLLSSVRFGMDQQNVAWAFETSKLDQQRLLEEL